MAEHEYRRNNGEEFEFYVERILRYFGQILDSIHFRSEEQFRKINERLDKMATLAEELGVEETTLAEVVPQLATEITTLQTSLTEREATIKTDQETRAQSEASSAKANAELAAIQKVQEQLAPVVEKAKSLVPVAPTPTPTPEGGTTPPAPVQEPTPPAENPASESPPAPTPETPTP
jgi:DNA repair ATPase RecN